MKLKRVPLPLLLAADSVLAVAAYIVAFRIRELVPVPGTGRLLPPERFAVVHHRWFAIVLVVLVGAYVADLYRDVAGRQTRELVAGALGGAGLAALGLVATYFFAADPIFPRTVVLSFWLVDAALLFAVRSIVSAFVHRIPDRVILVGCTETGRRIAEELASERRANRRIVGFLREEGDLRTESEFAGHPVLGRIEDAARIAEGGEIDEMLLVPDGDWRDRLLGEIARLGTGPRITVAPSLYEVLLGKLAHVNLRDRPLLEVVRDPSDPISRGVKRSFDVLLALAAGGPAVVLGILVALLVRAGSRGPVLFGQKRVGRSGRVFTLWKFRTMIDGAERETGPTLATAKDPRITRVGAFLRRSRLDELPQLLNVLLGDMSFVGPRPERPEFAERFAAEIPGWSHRELVRPGLTGLAQVRGGYRTDPDVKLMYDLIYVYNRTLRLDAVILLETARTVLAGRGVD